MHKSDQLTAAAPRDARWMLFVLLGLYVLSFMDRQAMIMMVQPLKANLGLSDFQVSLLMGPAFAVAYGLAAFPLGWCVDRFPRRRIIFLGAVAWSTLTVACGFAQGFVGLLAARIGVGAACASLTPAAYSLIADKFPRERMTTALSIYAMGPKIGQAVAFFLGAAVISAAAGISTHSFPVVGRLEAWQLVFIFLGAPGLLAALAVWSFTDPPRKGAAPAAAGDNDGYGDFLRQHRVLIALLVGGYTLITVVNGAIVSWTPAYLERRMGWTPAMFGSALGVITLIAGATLPLSGLFVDWVYRRGVKDAHTRVYTWLLVGMLPLGATYSLIANPFVLIVAYGLIQAIAVSFMLYVSATIPMISPPQFRGRLTAIFLFSLNLVGASIGPAVPAAITDFVFKDPMRVGDSMAITATAGFVAAWICLRAALKRLGPVIAAQAD